MSAPNIDTLLAGLDKVSKVGSGWKACCPAHDDHKPSLSLRESRRGRILVRCRSGCSQDEVIGALRAMGLWGTPGDRTMRPVVRRDVSPDLEEQQRDSRQGIQWVRCRKVSESDTIRRFFANGVQVVGGSNPLAPTNKTSINLHVT